MVRKFKHENMATGIAKLDGRRLPNQLEMHSTGLHKKRALGEGDKKARFGRNQTLFVKCLTK